MDHHLKLPTIHDLDFKHYVKQIHPFCTNSQFFMMIDKMQMYNFDHDRERARDGWIHRERARLEIFLIVTNTQ
jgi:hypothetical protein